MDLHTQPETGNKAQKQGIRYGLRGHLACMQTSLVFFFSAFNNTLTYLAFTFVRFSPG